MVYQFESDVKIDDEILMAELGSGGSVALKNIVRTIQKEQNAIIRNTKDKIMVIQGAAGSGKTSIALHRIAYLLYHDRKQSEILQHSDPVTKQHLFRLYFPYPAGAWGREYPGNEF